MYPTHPSVGEEALTKSQDNVSIDEEQEPLSLPIDEFEDEILYSIERQRIIIIQGETGCGKSSRVPAMILRAPVPHGELSEVRMFISQPRRIAAKSLVERVRACEPDLRHKIALRMGHGERQYETNETRAWFVTTGYLVRLLANNPERFHNISHLIIDEVHERSVDSDILCLLCKRLLQSNQNIRIVLMSATIASNMYAEYFGVLEPPIQVSGRRFPIQEFYVEDFMSKLKFPAKDQKCVTAIIDNCEKSKCRFPPSNTYMENLYQLAVRTAVVVGQPGTSVLIFVTGMNDIISITDLVDKQYRPGIKYTCFPIHSDVPFSEQMAAFDKPDEDEIKIIIGTNAAESSITLPDVDHVICLGLQKQIIYNAASHRQLLTPAWISRANAIQRAGRTGRVRNGNVYRLYTRRAFQEYMPSFEIGEMSRVPLDSVILELKQMMNEPATEVLLQCLEPPNLQCIERSFESLYDQNFLSSPDDNGTITELGSFVASIGVDLKLGSLIGLGIQFGVGPEAIEIAAILSFSKSPWIISNPLFHASNMFNEMSMKTFSSKCHFDANLYSDPLAIMNLIWDFDHIHNRKPFCWKFSLALPRLQRLVSTRNSIRSRVADFLGCGESTCTVQDPPSQMPHSKIIVLRIILVWVLHENLIKAIHVSNATCDHVTVALRKKMIQENHLEQILDKNRHPFQLITHREFQENGHFEVAQETTDFPSFMGSFEERLLSFCAEEKFRMAWYKVDASSMVLLVESLVVQSAGFTLLRNGVLKGFSESLISVSPVCNSNLRGRKGRACGLWKVKCNKYVQGVEDRVNELSFVRFATSERESITKLSKFLKIKALQTPFVQKVISCNFRLQKQKKQRDAIAFSLLCFGQVDTVSKQDLSDLFASGEISLLSRETSTPRQEVSFQLSPNTPMDYGKDNKLDTLSGHVKPFSSWNQPFFNDIPEGARLLSVIASSRRPEHFIEFLNDNDGENVIKVELSRSETRICDRWTSLSNGKFAFVEVNSVPAAAYSLDGPSEVFAVAGDSLALAGGGFRVSSLTLLPPGRLFLLLCLKSFGLHPVSERYGDEDEELDQCVSWLTAGNGQKGEISGANNLSSDAIVDKILQGIQFHQECRSMGEKLQTYPQFIVKLLSIFDYADRDKCVPWELSDSIFPPRSKNDMSRRNKQTQNALSRESRNVQKSVESKTKTGSAEISDDCDNDLKSFPTRESMSVHTMQRNPNLEEKTSKKKMKSVAIKAPTNDAVQVKASESKIGNISAPATKTMSQKPNPLKVKASDINEITSDPKLILPTNANSSPSVQWPIIPTNHCLDTTLDAKHIESTVPCIQKSLEGYLVTKFNKKIRRMTSGLFAFDLKDMDEIMELDLPSTNILAILIESYLQSKVDSTKPDETSVDSVPSQWSFLLKLAEVSPLTQKEPLALVPSQWQVYKVPGKNGKEWYSATFIGTMIPLTDLNGRKNVMSWMKSDVCIPSNNKDALKCVPIHYAARLTYWRETLQNSKSEKQSLLLFPDLPTALKMAAAYWLERQFYDGQRHWYQMTFSEMMTIINPSSN